MLKNELDGMRREKRKEKREREHNEKMNEEGK
jgi:hypothetical protein